MRLYEIPAGDSAGALQLDFDGERVPSGASVRVVVLDGAGNLLLDWSPSGAADSITVAVSGAGATAGSSLLVGIEVGSRTDSGGNPGPGAIRLQVASETGSPLLDVRGVVSSLALGNPPTHFMPSTPTNGTGPAVGEGSLGLALSAPGPGPTTGGAGVGPVAGPSLSTAATAGGNATQAAGIGGGEPATQGLSAPTSALSLPSSPYQPAGGILLVAGPAESVARVEETRVDMALVLTVSPGWDAPPSDVRSPDPGPTAPDQLLADAEPVARRVDVVRAGLVSLDSPAPSQPGDGTVPRSPGSTDLPRVIIDPKDGGRHTLWLASAMSAPADEPARLDVPPSPLPSGNAADRDEGRGRGRGPGEAIVLGLAGSAMLGVGLYGPDLAAAFRRAVPRPSRNPRWRQAPRGEV